MGRQICGPANNSTKPDSGKNNSSPSTLPGGKPRYDKMAVVILIAIAVCIIVMIIMGFLFMKEKHDDDEIVLNWDEIRQMADSTSPFTGGVSDVDLPENSGSLDYYTDYDIDEYMLDDAQPGDKKAVEQALVQASAHMTEPEKRVINFDNLTSVDANSIAWLYVPGTAVDYPIMQEPGVAESFYYMDHDMKGRASKAGSIFTPYLSGRNDAHLLVYGHRMTNGSMFGTLLAYRNKSFYDKYKYIYVYYPDMIYKYQVFAAGHATDGDRLYYTPFRLNSVEYQGMLDQIKMGSNYTTEVTADADNSKYTISLSTCDHRDSPDDLGRFVVSGVLVETTPR